MDGWCILGPTLIKIANLLFCFLLFWPLGDQYGWLFEIVHGTFIKLLPTYLIISNTQTWPRFHCEGSRTNRGTHFFVLAGTLAVPSFTCHWRFCGQNLLKTVWVSEEAPGIGLNTQEGQWVHNGTQVRHIREITWDGERTKGGSKHRQYKRTRLSK